MEDTVKRASINPRLLIISDRFGTEIIYCAHKEINTEAFQNLVDLYAQCIMEINRHLIDNEEWKSLVFKEEVIHGKDKPN